MVLGSWQTAGSILPSPMSSLVHDDSLKRSIRLALIGCVGVWLTACGTPPAPPPLPPSDSDLALMKSSRLCDHKTTFLVMRKGVSLQREHWGSGEELHVSSVQSESTGEESYFFDQDGVLVGALFAFPGGLRLAPYPVLQKTLSQLRPAARFYLAADPVTRRDTIDFSRVYETGDVKSTTRYIVMGRGETSVLFLASFALDPYSLLLSAYREEFLTRVERESAGTGKKPSSKRGVVDPEPFLALQQFARGEMAHFASCGKSDDNLAAEAYAGAIKIGFTNKSWLAESYHKLGLALDATGRLEEARSALLESIKIRPNVPEVYNSLGTVHAKLGNRNEALAAFEKAVSLRPNYAVARYNMAQAYEAIDPRRAVLEYETYIAIAEENPYEVSRVASARERIEVLSR